MGAAWRLGCWLCGTWPCPRPFTHTESTLFWDETHSAGNRALFTFIWYPDKLQRSSLVWHFRHSALVPWFSKNVSLIQCLSTLRFISSTIIRTITSSPLILHESTCSIQSQICYRMHNYARIATEISDWKRTVWIVPDGVALLSTSYIDMSIKVCAQELFPMPLVCFPSLHVVSNDNCTCFREE